MVTRDFPRKLRLIPNEGGGKFKPFLLCVQVKNETKAFHLVFLSVKSSRKPSTNHETII